MRRSWRRAAGLLAALAPLLSGCLGFGGAQDGDGDEQPRLVRVDPPAPGGGFAECASRQAQQLALPFTSEEVPEAGGLGPGLHRVDARTFLWVWASYREPTLREDEVTRVNEVQVFREADGRLVLCTRVEMVTPLEVDAEPRAYDVAVRLRAGRSLPEAPLRVVVNWLAGCAACGGEATGNATAHFAPHGA